MKLWPFKKESAKIKQGITIDAKPSMYFSKSVLSKLEEQFQGEVERKKMKFPAELGEEHPFDFVMMEKLYEKFGLFSAVVDKYVDFIVGPGFYIECDENRPKEIITEFMQDVNMDTLLRQWIKEALMKGNGFLELGDGSGGTIEGMKVLNANWMYVNRDEYGTVEGYKQYVGGFERFAKKKVNDFKPHQIAHLSLSVVGDCAYGLGIGYTALSFIDNWLKQNKSEHKLMDRKANSPLHAKFGYIDGDTKIIPKPEDVQAFGRDLELMDNKTEWVTDPLVEFKVVDFGNIGEKFGQVLESDLEAILYAFQIPAVLMGKANVPEGLARVQMEAFQRRIQSMQAEIEKIIETKIFKRVLNAQGFNVHVEFEWGTPSVMEVEGRMKLVSELMKSPMIGGAMNAMLQDEMVNLLKLDKDEYEKLKLEEQKKIDEERERLESQPQPQVPGQNKSFPQKPLPKAEQPKQPKPEEKIDIDKLMREQKNKIDAMIEEHKKLLEKKEQERTEKEKLEIEKIKKEMEELRRLAEEKKAKEELPAPKKPRRKLKRRTSLLSQARKRISLLSNFSPKKQTEKIKTKLPAKPLKKYAKRKNTNYEYNKECPHCQESWDNLNNIEEWLGFNYKQYLAHILAAIELYDFEQIKAVTEAELAAGYLAEEQIEKLRDTLRKGFENGSSIKDMAKEVDKRVSPRDLYRMTDDGKVKIGASGLPILAKSAEKRSIGIVRSEVTRMANQGAINHYKEGGIKQVSWVASFGERTCEICEGLNGQIFEINNVPPIPQHPLCRCTLSPVVELR